jgi:hypothetical protein
VPRWLDSAHNTIHLCVVLVWAERMRVEKKSSDSRQKELEKELEWINASPKARQAKSKARVSNYELLLEEAAQDERREQVSQLYVRISISTQHESRAPFLCAVCFNLCTAIAPGGLNIV